MHLFKPRVAQVVHNAESTLGNRGTYPLRANGNPITQPQVQTCQVWRADMKIGVYVRAHSSSMEDWKNKVC